MADPPSPRPPSRAVQRGHGTEARPDSGLREANPPPDSGLGDSHPAPDSPGIPDAGRIPGRDEVWTWWLDLDIGQGGALEQTRLLDASERRRADRRSGDHRIRFIAARAALRIILGRSLGIRPEEVGFRYGECGRPDLVSSLAAPGLRFNLSHSGPLGLVALVRDYRIGVDVERLRPIRHLDRIVERVLGERDRLRLAALPPPRLETEFFECWTRKEAVVKAFGGGIFGALDPATGRRDFSMSRGRPRPAVDPVDAALAGGAWTLVSLTPPLEGFAASLAVDRPGFHITDRTEDHAG